MTEPINPSYLCRVCGLAQDEQPWGEDGNLSSFNICDCCGTTFGYEDCLPISVKRAREKWLNAGGKWWAEKRKPIDWLLEQQLAQIPGEYQ
jgi:hypothetical protein